MFTRVFRARSTKCLSRSVSVSGHLVFNKPFLKSRLKSNTLELLIDSLKSAGLQETSTCLYSGRCKGGFEKTGRRPRPGVDSNSGHAPSLSRRATDGTRRGRGRGCGISRGLTILESRKDWSAPTPWCRMQRALSCHARGLKTCTLTCFKGNFLIPQVVCVRLYAEVSAAQRRGVGSTRTLLRGVFYL